MLIWFDFIGWDMVLNVEVMVYVIVCVFGLCVKIDEQIGWYKSLFNVGVNGVIGIFVDVFWDLQDLVIDVGLLNQNDVIMFVCKDGFCFWGFCSLSDDLFFVFENYICMVQVLMDMMVEVYMWVVDKLFNLLLVCDIIEGICVKMCSLVSQGYFIGGDCWLDELVNDKDILKVGKFIIDYDYMLVLLFENLMLCQCIIDQYLVNFFSQVSV